VVFYQLPPGALDVLMQCTMTSLSLQERYSLVATCTFLVLNLPLHSCSHFSRLLFINGRKRSSGGLRVAMIWEKQVRVDERYLVCCTSMRYFVTEL
jgi:hypothetical protein